MFSRLGLRFRMATSYVAVSAAAVLIVEALQLLIFIRQIQSARDSAAAATREATLAQADRARAKAESVAQAIASSAGTYATTAAVRQPGLSDAELLAGAGESVPLQGPGAGRDSGQVGMALAALDGGIVTAKGLTGSRLPAEAVTNTVAGDSGMKGDSGMNGDSGMRTVNGAVNAWSTRPVVVVDVTANPPSGATRVIGLAYEELQVPQPGQAPTVGDAAPPRTQSGLGVAGLLAPGALVLVLLVPVGVLFGLLSTGKLIRRIRRLALSTEAMAGGDLRSRIPVSGGDEVGQLEQAFNSMAVRLEKAIRAERDAASSIARRAERNRIARELHDSISQDLFSVSLVADGLRKALPSESKLWRQADSMEQTLQRTRREMRVLLMELRPVALEDAGLAAALHEMCRAYETRLGIPIAARIELSNLGPAVEHAALRVVQEALGNAVRHGNPTTIEVDVHSEGEKVSVTVRDDGTGFDLDRVHERHGLGLELIRERVEELGGSVQVDTTPGEGTTIRVTM